MDKKKYVEKRSFFVAVTFLFLIVMFFLYINISNFVFHKAGAELSQKTARSFKGLLEYSLANSEDGTIDLQLLRTMIRTDDFYLPLLNLTVYGKNGDVLLEEGEQLSLEHSIEMGQFRDDVLHVSQSMTHGREKCRVYEMFFCVFAPETTEPTISVRLCFNLDQFSDLFSGKQVLILIVFSLTLLILIFLVMIILSLQKQLFQSEEKIMQLNTHDEATGLLTRDALMEKLKSEIVRITQTGGQLAVITADLDHFLSICDHCGHEFGGHILKTVAGIFQGNLRIFDLAGRFGSDEIIAVMVGSAPEEAFLVAENCRKAICETEFFCNEEEIPVSMSFGISGFKVSTTEEHKPAEQIKHDVLFEALAALEQAKKKGKNCCVLQ